MKLTLNLELFFTYLSNCSNNDAKKYVWIYSVSNFALQDILCWIRTETVRRKFLVTNLFLQQIISLCVERYLCSAFLPFLSLSSPLLSSPLLPCYHPLPKPLLLQKRNLEILLASQHDFPWVMTPTFLYVLRVPEKSLGQKMYTQKLNQTVQRSQSPPSCFCIFFSSCCVYHNIKGH